MKKVFILVFLALIAFAQGAWAQTNWEEVYAMTQTTSADWTALNAGSTMGQTLGSAGNTTYYYANSNLNFTNSNAGGSGLTIQGTVYLYVPSGMTLTSTGANANGTTGAGAGIELTSGNTLYLIGSGTVNATGGNAANGGNGGNGTNATGYNGDWTETGTGGNGGYGGGGAGAGIGTKGGNGGNGGSGGSGYRYDDWTTHDGTNGSSGNAGSTAGSIGNLYVVTSFVNLSVTGGNAGSNGGSGGNRGRGYAWDGYSYNYTVAGGGGGGGGGFGGAASNIGTGGPGGGGGGGGAGGAQDYRSNSSGGVYDVTAYGGKGGKNANGSSAADGTEAPTTGTAYDQGWVTVENGSFDSGDWHSPSGDCSFGSGGSGGACGNASSGTNGTNISFVTSESTTMTSGIYVVLTDVTVPSRIQINGNVTLNLAEGATLHAPKGIEVSDIINAKLTINGLGTLTIDNCEIGKSGIGAERVGTIVINGGTINVNGGPSAAGIGGDIENVYGGIITINGGVVNATGGYDGAGIGGGRGRTTTSDIQNIGLCGTININGGQVTACGGGYGPGIGPGHAWLSHSSGTLTFQWTNHEEDFIYSTGYVTGVEPQITLISITFAKQFIIEGTATIANSSNIGGQKIVPYTTEQIPLSGEGTQGNPWRISSTADWNAFAQNVINGNSYSEQYVELMADIDITRGVGANDSRPFSGTFLGNDHTLTVNLNGHQQGTAPFICIGGATIKNLNVAGSITSHEYYTSGLVGFAYGTNLIEGCIVTATINQNNDYAGGFVGHGKTSATTIKDCIFSGTINGSDAVYHSIPGGTIQETTHNVGGIWCYGDEGSALTIQNCLEKGIFTTIDGMHPIGLQNGTADVTDTYYLTPQSGSLSHPVINGAYRVYAANTVEGEMLKPLLLLDGNTYYTCCLITIDDYYQCAGGSASVPPVVTAFDGTPLAFGTDYTVTLNGEAVAALPLTIYTGGSLTLVFTGMGSYIGSKAVETYVLSEIDGNGSASEPYIISSTEQWATFAYYVNNDNSYSGEFVRLDADIDVSETVGFRNDHPFSGTFLGNSHTIRVNISSTATGTGANEQGVAPFHYIKDATIKDLTVAGSIASASYHTSGLVGFADGTNLIENCAVTATLNISSNYASGIIGHGKNSNTTIRGCAFFGTINGVGDKRNYIGGILGEERSGTFVLENCLEHGTYYNIGFLAPMGWKDKYYPGDFTITNCYYSTPINTPPTMVPVNGNKQAYVFTTAPANLGGLVQDYGALTAYQNGILYDGTYYVASTGSISLTVEGYGNDNDHWAFIASPVAVSIAPTAVGNLLGTQIQTEPTVLYDYDLYRLNPTSVMWENYNNPEHQSSFNLENGGGYLYATKETKTLVFSGTFNTGTEKAIGGLSAGFNLVGNPFIVDAYVSKPYYTLDGEGATILAQQNSTATPIAPCHGVIVQVDGSENVTFSTTAPELETTHNNGGLNIALTQANTRGAEQIDNAIVSFNEGTTLGKFYFGKQNANIYLPQGNKDYAITFSEGQGEMPLNFKANENGTYTISVHPEGVEMDYLHLIDNMTGADVDLLAANGGDAMHCVSTYTFTAKTTDYESRFKLVFAAKGADGPSTGSGPFAFISNGNIIINGEGTLQVVDVMGRVIVSDGGHTRCVPTNGMTAGVYVLRLINGNDVKTQKIVVR